ncbi:MAG: hypothetical protein Q7S04_04255 [Candidatus Moranbacteria bacterium]|nr:hypothetical protein [Candidatus Moranbacteria bacterium]
MKENKLFPPFNKQANFDDLNKSSLFEGQGIFPEKFRIPKIEFKESETKFAETTVFDFEVGELHLSADVHLSADKEVGDTVVLEMNFSDKKANKRVAEFQVHLGRISDSVGADVRHGRVGKRIWRINHRLVNENYRQRGLGTTAFCAIEKTIGMINQNNPELVSNFLEVGTSYTSVARIIIDHEWLGQQNSGGIKNKNRHDFHYIPVEGAENDARKLVSEKKKGRGPFVSFRKYF